MLGQRTTQGRGAAQVVHIDHGGDQHGGSGQLGHVNACDKAVDGLAVDIHELAVGGIFVSRL